MDKGFSNFPRQALPFKRKTKAWRESCVRFADKNSVLSSSTIRKTVAHKKLNYDLLSGEIHMSDLEEVINPGGVDYGVPTRKIQHYPVMNNKIMLLLGEERESQFDYKIVVTNPEAISEIEENKKAAILERLQSLIQNTAISDEEAQDELGKLQKFFKYDWQDFKEIKANCLVKHYSLEQNFDSIFNSGMEDVLAVNEEIYQCTIEQGEPILKKLNPKKVYTWGSGYSNKIEDASMIVIEDYWSPGQIIDTYWDALSKKDIDKIEGRFGDRGSGDQYGDKGDPRMEFRFGDYIDNIKDGEGGWLSFNDGTSSKELPYDVAGNIRVLQVYWKSLRKIKKVKTYDPSTGNTDYKIMNEDYIPDINNGEEEEIFYINEAWEGTMIGSGDNAIFINIRPCPVQYNRITNPSKCHFGIIGTIYNFSDNKPYSMIDMMKPLVYSYDVTKDSLNRLLSRNLGKLLQLNINMVPAGWTVEKWLYYAKANGLLVIDPMKEGTSPAAKGKMAGMFATAPQVDTELGNSIQGYINLLEYIKTEISEMVGITKQREGQISNRETVGGVERATLQSSHSTRWYFAKHEDTKKRVIECFLDTAQVALRGNPKKMQYILPDHAVKTITIDEDFCNCDYGLVVDSSYDMRSLNQEIQQIAQAATQAGTLAFSTYLKLRSNCSMRERIRMIEENEDRVQQQQAEQQQAEQQAQEQALQANMAIQQAQMQLQDNLNMRDNETKLLIANMNAMASTQTDDDGVQEAKNEMDRKKLEESIRQFNAQLDLDNKRLAQEDRHHHEDLASKEKIARMKPKTTNTSKK